MQLEATWEPTSDNTLAQMNTWNRTKMVGTASLNSKGNVALSMWVNLRNGVSAENLHDSFEWWEFILGDFKDFLSE
nr:YbjN domain-containing protein [Deinococcus knuensis]